MLDDFLKLFTLEKLVDTGIFIKIFPSNRVLLSQEMSEIKSYNIYINCGIVQQTMDSELYFTKLIYNPKYNLLCVDLDCHVNLVGLKTEFGGCLLDPTSDRGWYSIKDIKLIEHKELKSTYHKGRLYDEAR